MDICVDFKILRHLADITTCHQHVSNISNQAMGQAGTMKAWMELQLLIAILNSSFILILHFIILGIKTLHYSTKFINIDVVICHKTE